MEQRFDIETAQRLKRTPGSLPMKIYAGLLLGLWGTCVAASAWGAPVPVGYVMTVQGDATVQAEGISVPATVGTPVVLGAVLETGKGGSLGLTLEDGSVMSFGPDSTFTMDAFAFDPARNAFALQARLERGTLNYVAGMIGKLAPQAVEVRTPHGAISTRSPQFLAKVEHEPKAP